MFFLDHDGNKSEKMQKRAARFAGTLGEKHRSEPLTLQINNYTVSHHILVFLVLFHSLFLCMKFVSRTDFHSRCTNCEFTNDVICEYGSSDVEAQLITELVAFGAGYCGSTI
jgi:hypothetical protein